MSFLMWNNQKDAEDALAIIDKKLGCPFQLENGYRMDTYAIISKSSNEQKWGFYKPKYEMEKTKKLMSEVKTNYTEGDKPKNWSPEKDSYLK